MKRWTVISSVVSTLFVASILTFGLSTEIASAHGQVCKGHHKGDMNCNGGGGGGDPSEGGKAFLFEINEEDVLICGGAIDTAGASSGQFSVAGNVLWDPEFIHVHFKLQLKDVDPGTYPIFGNNDIACPVGTMTNPLDFPACEGDICTVGHVSITVKQNRQGRTSGVLRLPGQNCGETIRVWVRVDVTLNGVETDVVELRSTPVTIVLPPNAVGDESCI